MSRSLDAVSLTLRALALKYPHVTDQGYLRATDTAMLYRRIGKALLTISPGLRAELLEIESILSIGVLRRFGKKHRTSQENTTYARILVVRRKKWLKISAK